MIAADDRWCDHETPRLKSGRQPDGQHQVDIDWRSLLVMPTPEIVRRQTIAGDDGAGILWSSDGGESRELSALGVLAWEGREGKPSGPRYEWVGLNLLCNAAPTPFVLNGENFYCIDSFYEALKIPEALLNGPGAPCLLCIRRSVPLAGITPPNSHIEESESPSTQPTTRPFWLRRLVPRWINIPRFRSRSVRRESQDWCFRSPCPVNRVH